MLGGDKVTRRLGNQNVEEADETPNLKPKRQAYNFGHLINRLSASELLHVIEIGAIYRALLHKLRRRRTVSI